jgi:uncharacterized protein (DUF2062 family)
MSQSMSINEFDMLGKLSGSVVSIKRNPALWLRQGISPRRLALTLALGFAIGCIPVIGIPTVLCAALALLLRLNLPAIQAANYAVMPLQLVLLVPFVRLGGWLLSSSRYQGVQPGNPLHAAPMSVVARMSWLAGQALLAWAVLAIPAVLFLTFTLTLLLRRIPALAAAEAGN